MFKRNSQPNPRKTIATLVERGILEQVDADHWRMTDTGQIANTLSTLSVIHATVTKTIADLHEYLTTLTTALENIEKNEPFDEDHVVIRIVDDGDADSEPEDDSPTPIGGYL